MLVWSQVGLGEAVLCLEGTRQEKGQGGTSASPFFSPRAGARAHLGLCDPLRIPFALFVFEQTAAKAPSPQGP